MNTRTSSIDRLKASNNALNLLRAVHALVGAENANLAKAFQFGTSDRSLRRGGRDRRRNEDDSPAEYETTKGDINTDIATTGSVWSRAEDFWHVVGWAFNCSITHPPRWERWRLWLEFMLDVLEDDWRAHERDADAVRVVAEDQEAEISVLMGSLISNYLQMDSRRYGGVRRTVRAIFADGSEASLREFKEVFSNETRKPKEENGATKKRQDVKVNVEEDMYGDYMDSDDQDEDPQEGTEVPSTARSRSLRNREHNASTGSLEASPTKAPDHSAEIDGFDLFGGLEAFKLRLRLLAMLSAVSARLSANFTPLDSLYSIYSDHIRPLPLPTFSLIISPTLFPEGSSFTTGALSSLTQLILRSFITSSAPLPPVAYGDDISQGILEESYLPYTANTNSAVDNAKTSLLIEALLRTVAYHVGLEGTPGLKEAVEAGIKAREAKAKPDGRKKSGNVGDRDAFETAKWWMSMSSMRMRTLVQTATVPVPNGA
ncbi:MAG: hypothetical protein M4579_002707 [Chaenotheca gracillima]|nr:MAG: hypothetical protein M4579_002707 [Chaenotheca gracillima]